MSEFVSLRGLRKERLMRQLAKVRRADKDLEPKRELVREYIRAFSSPRDSGLKTFPFYGASNVYIPMVAIARDAIKARILNALLGQDQDFNVEPIVEGPIGPGSNLTWRDVAETMQEYLQFEMGPGGQIPFRDHVFDIIEDASITGTAFPSVLWEDRYGYDLVENELVPTITRSNIELRCPAIDRLIFPRGYSKIDRIPFISEKYVLRPSEVLARVDNMGWNAAVAREILRAKGGLVELSDFDQEYAEQDEDPSPYYENDELWFAETWIRADLDGSGREIPLVVDHTLDDPPRILRVFQWPYQHGRMRFVQPVPYERRKDRLLGRGIAEIGAHANEAINTILNQIIDRGTLANSLAWSVNEDVVSLESIRMWRPGQPIPRGDDPNAINEIRVGDATPGLFEGLNILFSLFEKLIKVSDYDLGREAEQVGRQGTATGTLALLQQSGQFFDLISRNVRHALNEEGYMMLNLIAQYKPFERIASVVGGDRAEAVVAALSLPPRELNKRLGIYVAFSRDAASKEIQRQQEMLKYQVVEGYYKILIEGIEMWVQRPYLRPALVEIGKDAHLRMRRLLESMGESYNNRTLPSFEDFVKQLEIQDANLRVLGTSLADQSVPPQPGGDQPPAGAVVPSGVGGAGPVG